HFPFFISLSFAFPLLLLQNHPREHLKRNHTTLSQKLTCNRLCTLTLFVHPLKNFRTYCTQFDNLLLHTQTTIDTHLPLPCTAPLLLFYCILPLFSRTRY